MLYILLVISIIINVLFFICIYKSLSLIEQLEEWLIRFKSLMESLYQKLKQIDDRDMFEKDDEVGVIFRQIVNIINETKKVVIDDKDSE